MQQFSDSLLLNKKFTLFHAISTVKAYRIPGFLEGQFLLREDSHRNHAKVSSGTQGVMYNYKLQLRIHDVVKTAYRMQKEEEVKNREKTVTFKGQMDEAFKEMGQKKASGVEKVQEPAHTETDMYAVD